MSTRGVVPARTGQIHYLEAGSGARTVVLVPQAGRSSRMYAELVERLGEHLRAIAIDVPGTGASDPAPAGLEIPDYGDALLDALDQLEIGRFTLFGPHGGNKVATSIAVRHPHRVTWLVVAGQSHSIVSSNVERAAAFARTPSITAVVSAKEAEAGSALLWSREFRDLTDIWWTDDVVSPPSSAGQAVAVEAAVESLQAVLHRPHFYRAAFTYDLEAEFAALRVPTLFLELVTPKEDREFGRQGGALLADVPGSTLRVLAFADPGYAVTLEVSAELVAGILREFAEQHGRPRSLPYTSRDRSRWRGVPVCSDPPARPSVNRLTIGLVRVSVVEHTVAYREATWPDRTAARRRRSPSTSDLVRWPDPSAGPPPCRARPSHPVAARSPGI